jgi:PKD repeat protein
VTDDGGKTGSDSVAVSVSADPTNRPPSASCSASPVEGEAPLTVAFTGSGSDPDGTITSYLWSFGDGASSTEQSPGHTYSLVGTYTATLTVSDDGGATGQDLVVITVNQGPFIEITSPVGGEVWYVGTTPRITWRTNLEDCAIRYTASGWGETTITYSVDSADPGWLDYPWQVPDTPSTECRVSMSGYFGEAPTESGVFEITAVTDTDSDGMDDGWETAHFGDLSHDGTADTDGDGLTDYQEFMAATDPAAAGAETDGGLGLACMTGQEGPGSATGAVLAWAACLAFLDRRRALRRARGAGAARPSSSKPVPNSSRGGGRSG